MKKGLKDYQDEKKAEDFDSLEQLRMLYKDEEMLVKRLETTRKEISVLTDTLLKGVSLE